MTKLCAVVLLGALAGCPHRTELPLLVSLPEPGPRSILFENVALFSAVEGEDVRTGVHVLVADGKVTKISEQPLEAGSAQRIDGAGMMLLPGLIDTHVHIGQSGAPPTMMALANPERNLSAFLYAGVTSVIDMGGDPDALRDLAAKVEAGKTPGPRVRYAGAFFTHAGGHPAALIRELVPWPLSMLALRAQVREIDADTDIGSLVDENVAKGASLTKIAVDQIPLGIPSLSTLQIAAVVDASKKHGLRTVAHIGSEADVKEALAGGVRTFIHAPYRSTLSVDTAAQMAREGAVSQTTAGVFHNVSRSGAGKLDITPLDREVADPEIITGYEQADPKSADPMLQGISENARRFEDTKFDNLKVLKAAGVPLIVASDSPNVGQHAGSALHRELELLVKRGVLTPVEAVRAATSIPARHFAKELGTPGVGELVEGAPADLILIEGDFRDDMRRLSEIRAVVSRGALLTRADPSAAE